MKIKSVFLARNVLGGLADVKTSAKLAYCMAKFIKKTDDDEKFYTDKVREIFQKYAKIDENGKMSVPDEVIDAYNAEIDELENLEIEDPGVRFSMKDLADLQLTIRQIYPLQDFITED